MRLSTTFFSEREKEKKQKSSIKVSFILLYDHKACLFGHKSADLFLDVVLFMISCKNRQSD